MSGHRKASDLVLGALRGEIDGPDHGRVFAATPPRMSLWRRLTLSVSTIATLRALQGAIDERPPTASHLDVGDNVDLVVEMGDDRRTLRLRMRRGPERAALTIRGRGQSMGAHVLAVDGEQFESSVGDSAWLLFMKAPQLEALSALTQAMWDSYWIARTRHSHPERFAVN